MLINICFGFMMLSVSLIEFSKRVQNEISAKVMPKAQNFTRELSGHFFRIGSLRRCDLGSLRP
jgi:hypothetical protein